MTMYLMNWYNENQETEGNCDKDEEIMLLIIKANRKRSDESSLFLIEKSEGLNLIIKSKNKRRKISAYDM